MYLIFNFRLQINTLFFSSLQEFVESFNLKSDQVVLDVGCGIGGGDFYMAKVIILK